MVKQLIFRTILLIFLPAIINAQEVEFFFTDKIATQESQNYRLKSNFIESASYSDYDLIYQQMKWDVNPEIYYIKGAITSHFVCKSDSLSDIEFDMYSELIVDSIIQDNKQLDYLRKENKITIGLNRTLKKNESDSITIYYRGEPASSGFESFVKSSHNGVPIIWTLSEPYGALDWWPCKQSLSDKIDSIYIIVTSPEQYRTASNGVLISETTENGLRTSHWKHRHPIATYLVAIAITNYIDYSDYLNLDDGRQIQIQNFVYPEDESYSLENTPQTIEIMELYNELVGEYPFADEKYGHAQFGWLGGMEHQTISFMYNFGFELVAHELAHQWFGDYITLASWQDIWLNEGFATYLSGLAYENIKDNYWWQRWKRLNVERIVGEPGGSVFVQDTTNVGRLFSSRLSYSKGAYLLHMLRWVMGDENFFKGLKNYFEDPKVANGFATTSQFVNQMEAAGDTSFTEFFNDWFFGEGFPIYSAQFTNTESQELQITLSQTTSHESVEFFEMPVPIRVYSSARADSADFRLLHTQNNQTFTVNPGFKVAELRIDPEYWLVLKTEEVVQAPIIGKEFEFSIYPNPFKEVISVSISSRSNPLQLGLYNNQGKLIRLLDQNKNHFNLSSLSNGVYILQLKTENEIIVRKIVKQ